MELVECRREGIGPPSKLRQWVDSRRESFRKRLIELDLIDATSIATDTPLIVYLDGRKNAEGEVVEPGWQQAIAARGTTSEHVARSVDRVRRILEGCDFIFWRDLVRPGAATDIEVFLGGLRTKGEIGGKTLNYYIREFKSFCRWLKESGRAPAPLSATSGADARPSDAPRS